MLKHFKCSFEFYKGFENFHFGLRLPPTILNYAFVINLAFKLTEIFFFLIVFIKYIYFQKMLRLQHVSSS